MAKEDILLGVEMGKLEIEPSKVNKNKFTNLPQPKKFTTLKIPQNYKCVCLSQKKNKTMTICKRKHRILKEPILKLPQSCNRIDYNITHKDITVPALNQVLNSECLNLHALVDNCNQLSISTVGTKKKAKVLVQTNENIEWWKNNVTHDKHGKEVPGKGPSTSCSQQALNPPCDVTIDELASYFETLVHIPKKMSSMAEMMYI